ncbi:22791_t:CDS:2, partial [Dentiscutata erythropus]
SWNLEVNFCESSRIRFSFLLEKLNTIRISEYWVFSGKYSSAEHHPYDQELEDIPSRTPKVQLLLLYVESELGWRGDFEFRIREF